MNKAEARHDVVIQPTVLAEDERGVIERLLQGDFQSVLRTTQKKGTIRANHYHKHDSHTGYVVTGKVHYMTRPVLTDTTTGKLVVADESYQKIYIVEQGQLFHTPPMVAHATVALEDTDILYFTPRSGQQGEYENDVIRVELISPADAKILAEKHAAGSN